MSAPACALCSALAAQCICSLSWLPGMAHACVCCAQLPATTVSGEPPVCAPCQRFCAWGRLCRLRALLEKYPNSPGSQGARELAERYAA